MEILTPLHQPQPTELTQRPSRAELSASPSFTEIAEEDENGGERREKVYVAVGTNVDKAFSLIRWTVRTFKSSDVCLVHAHQPSPLIPTLLRSLIGSPDDVVGKMPASRASPEVVTAFRNEEREKMEKLLDYYVNICLKAKVKASFIITEAEQVRVGLMELVNNHHIKKLVMGSVSTNPGKVTKRPSKANYAAKNAPTFCSIWFIYKGNHVWTRESCEEATFPSTCQEELITGSLRSKSFQYDTSECLYSSDHLRFNSLRLSMGHSDVNDCVQNECSDEDLLLPHTLSRSLDSSGPSFNRSSTSNDSSCSMSAERSSSGSDAKLVEESLYSELLELNTELEKSKNDMLVVLLKREKMEAEAIQAIRKVKDIRFIHSRENELRKEAEDALRNMLHEQERLLEERLEVTGELQKTMRSIAVLDSRVQEANRRCDEAAMELKLVQVCIANLHQEKQMIQRQKIEADRWLQKRRSCRHNGGTSRQGCGGLLDDVPELVEFSLLDLQTATCNFSESFKLGERGYCSVYKGELLGKTVAIQRLHGHIIQGPSQFQKEVQLLSKLRHPHLVNLIGACSEAWSLVCDYVPNTLQCCLFQKSKNIPLSWKIRARIISEISTALLFLHSSYPEKIVHGDIIPVNILLDSDLHVKICDFGISKLLTQDTLCSPSFRSCNEPKGAFPYTDPELHRTGKLTPKSDVYSFGIVILQLLTGQPPVGLVSNVRKAVSSGKLALLLDPCAGIWGPFVAEKLADMALRFCEPNSRDRPELTPSLVKELQQLHISQEQSVPSFFSCPIQQEIMCDPQVAADGFTYDGEAIREWLENGRETSPMTNLRLDHLHLTPNHSLRLAIQEWLCKY